MNMNAHGRFYGKNSLHYLGIFWTILLDWLAASLATACQCNLWNITWSSFPIQGGKGDRGAAGGKGCKGEPVSFSLKCIPHGTLYTLYECLCECSVVAFLLPCQSRDFTLFPSLSQPVLRETLVMPISPKEQRETKDRRVQKWDTTCRLFQSLSLFMSMPLWLHMHMKCIPRLYQ